MKKLFFLYYLLFIFICTYAQNDTNIGDLLNTYFKTQSINFNKDIKEPFDQFIIDNEIIKKTDSIDYKIFLQYLETNDLNSKYITSDDTVFSILKINLEKLGLIKENEIDFIDILEILKKTKSKSTLMKDFINSTLTSLID